MTRPNLPSIKRDMKSSWHVVTGGAGFIGSNLVRALVRRGSRVRVVDDLSTGRRDNLADVLGNIELLEGDVRDRRLMEQACQDADTVFHLAAIPSVQRSVEDPDTVVSVAVEGTLTVLEAARSRGVRRVVYSASSSAYGNTPSLPKREDQAPDPLSPYAAGKLAGEHLCRAFSECYGLSTVSLRYFNVFGPHQDPNSQYAAVIPKFIAAYLTRRRPVVYGDGLQSRDFTYVDNVVDANLKAAEATTLRGETVNVACGRSITLLELLETLTEIFGYHLEPEMAPPRKGDVRHSRADLSRARELLGYEPRVDFSEGLRKTVEWYARHLTSHDSDTGGMTSAR